MVFIKNLKQYLDKKIASFVGNWSYLIEKENEQTIFYNENYIHKSASMIKVLILSALCDSNIDFNEKVRLDIVPHVEGGGALQEINKDALITIKSIASLMIVLSDNLATNILIHKLGMTNIQDYAQKLKLTHTKIQRYMMDFVSANQGKENYMTVVDYNRLLWHIYDNRHLKNFDIAWQILSKQQFKDRIPYYWNEDVLFYHKTGMLNNVEHDGGILKGTYGTYSIIIFASNLPSNALGANQINELGHYIFNYLEKIPQEKSY